jgi:hypothetical protein
MLNFDSNFFEAFSMLIFVMLIFFFADFLSGFFSAQQDRTEEEIGRIYDRLTADPKEKALAGLLSLVLFFFSIFVPFFHVFGTAGIYVYT